jgi:glycosyltransferase involved in cell wall biosynthesis
MNVGPNPFFSLVIPTFNYARYLARAIESILDQEGEDYEIIVVDDGSTDNTAEVVHDYEARSQGRVRYIFQENQGPGAARNYGVALSTGQNVLFLDGDDALLPGALERFRTGVGERESVDFVWGGILKHFADGTFEHHPAIPLSKETSHNFRRHLRSLWVMKVGSVAIRRRVFDRIRFPESNRGYEHCVFNAHLMALYHGMTIPDPVVSIYTHDDTLCHSIEWTKMCRLQTVDLLFNAAILPGTLMHLRNEYLCGLWTSLFRDFQGDLSKSDAAVRLQHLRAIPRLVKLATISENSLPGDDREVAQACLSLFRSLYVMGHFVEAIQVYRLAFHAFPMQALRWRHLRKYARIVLGGLHMKRHVA